MPHGVGTVLGWRTGAPTAVSWGGLCVTCAHVSWEAQAFWEPEHVQPVTTSTLTIPGRRRLLMDWEEDEGRILPLSLLGALVTAGGSGPQVPRSVGTVAVSHWGITTVTPTVTGRAIRLPSET